MNIRLATEEDVTGIIEVESTAWVAQYPNTELGITADDIRTIDWSGKVPGWQHMIKSAAYHVWVAFQEQQILGFIAIADSGDNAEIQALYVLPSYQGSGIGTKLLTTVTKRLTSANIFLQVAAYNHVARAFYERHGFNTTGAEGVYDLPNDKLIPTVQMHKRTTAGKRRVMLSRAKTAKALGVRDSTIKWYSELGLIPFVQADSGLRRYYDLDKVRLRLQRIKELQREGKSLEDIVSLID